MSPTGALDATPSNSNGMMALVRRSAKEQSKRSDRPLLAQSGPNLAEIG
jgi:hypothetical protein